MFFRPWAIFGIIALSVSVVAGFFIRQKILNDWEIAEFNLLLKQIKDLSEAIDEDKKNLEDYEKLKISTKDKNKDMEQKIYELGEFINKYDAKFEILKSKHTFSKQAKGIESISNNYKKLKEKINSIENKSKLQELNRLLSSYYKTITNYIDYRNNTLKEINKNRKNKEKIEQQKTILEEEIKKNENFLSKLKELIENLNKSLKIKKSELSILQIKNLKKINY